MKITCPFCKLEYSVPDIASRGFQCVACGHVWRPLAKRNDSRGWVFALSCAVLLLALFSFAALVLWTPSGDEKPLIARVESATRIGDALSVSVSIENKSDKLRGIPDVVVALKDSHGSEVASKKFAPPAPLLDAGEAVMLLALVPDVPAGAVKISAEFKE